MPGQKRTYGVNVKADLSTRFADWIETNLLKLDTSKVRTVKFDNYKVDLEQGVAAGRVADDRAQGLVGPVDDRAPRSRRARS